MGELEKDEALVKRVVYALLTVHAPNPVVREAFDRICALARRAEEAEGRVLEVVRGEFTQICSYCGKECQPPNGWEELQEHIKVCERHPLREAEREAAGLREAMEDAATLCDNLEWLEAHGYREASDRRGVEHYRDRVKAKIAALAVKTKGAAQATEPNPPSIPRRD